MQSFQLVGKTIECECGTVHRIQPSEVLYADDAIARMPSLCRRHCQGSRAAVIFDARTREAAGEPVASAMGEQGWTVQRALLEDRPGGGSPVCEPATRERLGASIVPVDLIVAVGSGVVSDLGKWLAFERGIPAVTFGTAASMNGYAAANVAATVEGVKVLVRARPPAAVATSPQVLHDAPAVMTAAGLGDALAKSVSSADWRMNHLLFGDYYCARSVGLIAEIEPLYLDHPGNIRLHRPEAMAALFDALLLTGMAMTMAESSHPASGGEHLISHTLDMTAMAMGIQHDLHGRQVGVGTILTCELYRRVLEVESPALAVVHEDIHGEFWGELSEAVAQQYAKKIPRYDAAVEALSHKGAWDDLRRELAAMVRPPRTIADCLATAGAACRAGDIGCGRRRIGDVLLYAHQMRARFTILDLARLVGIMPVAAGEVLDQWA